MTPDEIKNFVQANYPDIVFRPLGRGWSFWYRDVVIRPGYSSRIARARYRSSGRMEFLRAASSWVEGRRIREAITGPEHLRQVFDQELRLWRETFEE